PVYKYVCLKTELRGQLCRAKDPTPELNRSVVLYKIPCGECNMVYIGETRRTFGVCLKEHQADLRLGKADKSAVAQHAMERQHSPSWDNAKVLLAKQHYFKRKWREAIKIIRTPDNMNRDADFSIDILFHPM